MNKPSINLCWLNGAAGNISTHALWALGAAVRALEEVVAAYEREEETRMMTCSICGELYWPTSRWHEDWCQECAINFKASEELRVHGEIEPGGSLSVTPRQVQAMRRMAERHQRQAEDTPDALR